MAVNALAQQSVADNLPLPLHRRLQRLKAVPVLRHGPSRVRRTATATPGRRVKRTAALGSVMILQKATLSSVHDRMVSVRPW